MRADMRKVLTESPRAGSRRSYHDVRKRENRGNIEDLPYYKGIRRPYKEQGDCKEFTDHISPLIRYLWSCVGRPWDDVWSEICERVPSNNVVDGHLKDHVLGEVDQYCFVKDDEVYVIGKYWKITFKPRRLYVDPRDGLLKAGANDESHTRQKNYKNNKETVKFRGFWYYREINDILVPAHSVNWYYPRQHWNAKQLPQIKIIPGTISIDFAHLNVKAGNQVAALIDGIWYIFDTKAVPPAKLISVWEYGEIKQKKIEFPQRDQLDGQSYSEGAYLTNKRQLNSRDLKRYGLRNTK